MNHRSIGFIECFYFRSSFIISSTRSGKNIIGSAKKRLTLGSLEADQLGILAFPGAVERPHPGIVQRVEMQSVHGADRFSTTVHLLINTHSTINLFERFPFRMLPTFLLAELLEFILHIYICMYIIKINIQYLYINDI